MTLTATDLFARSTVLGPTGCLEWTGWCNDDGRYGAQWIWVCTSCGKEAKPATLGAVEIIDWALPCPRIGDRKRPLAKATRARILAGLQRYGWAPITTTGAGNVHEALEAA